MYDAGMSSFSFPIGLQSSATASATTVGAVASVAKALWTFVGSCLALRPLLRGRSQWPGRDEM